jgi:hypothetical protein
VKKLAVLIALGVLVLAGCSSTSGPSASDVSTAFNAVSDAMTEVMSLPIPAGQPTGGPNDFVLTLTDANAISVTYYNDPAWTYTQTVTFTGYTISTYTITGTLNFTGNLNSVSHDPTDFHMTVTGEMTVTGAPVSKLTCDINAVYNGGTGKFDITGTVTADGETFDVADLTVHVG